MSVATTGPRDRGADDPDLEILEWDSDKFGFPVAKVRRVMSAIDLRGAIERMRALGVVLAYYVVPESSRLADRDAAALGATLIDTRVTLVRRVGSVVLEPVDPLSRFHHADFTIESYRRGGADPALVELARNAGRFSRFRVDPRIDAAVFHAIYDAWLVRSVRREIAQEVYVARAASELVGLVTMSTVGRRGTIGLLSVHESARGRGLGRALAELASAWSTAQRLPETQVATQLANAPACALYEGTGYVVERREPTYHIWLA